MDAIFKEVDEILVLKIALVDAQYTQFCAKSAAAAAAAEEQRVTTLHSEDAEREAKRLELARNKQRVAEADAQAASRAASMAEEQSRALAAARAAKEAERAAEEEAYKAKQRHLAAQREQQEAANMVKQKEQQATAARLVLESRSKGSAGALQAAGLTAGVVNEAHSLQQLDSYIQTTRSTGMPCVVDYFAPWCGPCVHFAPTFQSTAAQQRDVIFIKVNCDSAPGVTTSKGIRAYPTFHSYVRGALRQSWSGASLPKLQAALTDAVQAEEDAALQDAMAMSGGTPAASGGGHHAPPSPQQREGPPDYSVVPGLMAERPMGVLLQSFAETVSCEEFAAACKLLRAYAKNITEVGKRDEAKYRSVKISNAAFLQRLGKHTQFATQLMQCTGFTLEGDVWQLPIDSREQERAAADARPVLEAAARQAAEAVAVAAAPRPTSSTTPAPVASPQPSVQGSGLAGLANAFGGGGGGMAGLLQNPELMRAAQQMMGGGGLDPSMLSRLAGNPQLAGMAQQLMQNPQAMQQAQQMMRNPQAMGQAQRAMGTAPASAPASAPSVPARQTTAPTLPAAAAAGGGSESEAGSTPEDAELEALASSLLGSNQDGV
jgi:thiol-disulfide isomerase/thioredoxin